MAPKNPELLVKYCTAEQAQQILQDKSLTWYAPGGTRDPFELNADSGLPFDQQSLLNAAIKTATAMIFASEAPTASTPLASAIRRWRDEDRFNSADEAREVLKDLLSKMIDHRLLVIDQLVNDWKDYASRIRLCSFFARPDNPLAWELYGGHHQGVALAFKCLIGSQLAKAKAVKYVDHVPEITSLKQQLDAIVFNRVVDVQHSFETKCLTRSSQFSTLEEWRCLHKMDANDDQPTVERPFNTGLVAAIFFGAHCTSETTSRCLKWVESDFSGIQCFQGRASRSSYKIEFERMETASDNSEES